MAEFERDPKQRFSSRVENYVRYRPSYPEAILELLERECGLRRDSTLADVGSGTGILAQLFLRNGNWVHGIEPNREMREAGERLLARYPRFRSVEGTAEATTLPDRSVDIVTAGQAFHWFEVEAARREFARILQPEGWVVLVWNERRPASTPFLVEYENLLRTYGPAYEAVRGTARDSDRVVAFFGPGGFEQRTFDNFQRFDLEALTGRLLSSSYTPEPGHPNHAPMLAELDSIFRAHQVEGVVTFEYDTLVYFVRLRTRGV